MTLRVRLEIVKHGDENDVKEISRLDISNIGEAEFGHSCYRVIDFTKNEEGVYEKKILHRRHLGPWELVRKVITELEPKVID